MSSTPPASGTQLPLANPLNQTFFLATPQYGQIPVWLPLVDRDMAIAISTSINYGSQIGACFVMLLVVLTMTARTRFSRTATLLNIANLVVGIVRCTLLALYFVSSYFELYTIFSGDHSHVRARDVRQSAVAAFFPLPQLVLVEAALFLQAYSMIQLWPTLYKALALAVSAVVVVGGVSVKTAAVVLRMRAILDASFIPAGAMWVQQADLAFLATTIFWFCFIFIIRIVLHMFEYRSILPPLGGISAMEVLVMTNGVLMLVPVVFAIMELAHVTQFESGALTITSVIVLLPLGTLIAQSATRRNGSAGGGSGGSGSASRPPYYGGGCHGSRRPSAISNSNSNIHSYNGGSSSKQNTLQFGTWSQSSNTTTTALVPGGTGTTQVKIQSGAAPLASFSKSKTLVMQDAVDQELQRLNAMPAGTTATTNATDRVWVDREIDVRHDVV